MTENTPITVPVASDPPPAAGPPPAPDPSGDAGAQNRMAAYIALASAVLAVVGSFEVWVMISIAGLSPPGSTQTGWDGGDGRTILVAGLAAAVAAGALLIGRRDLWIKILLLISGAIAAIIAVVNMVDAGSKAHDIQVEFGIPSGDVKADIGIGLFMVVIAGIGMLAAGLRVRTSTS
jgi:hypothetical protein